MGISSIIVIVNIAISVIVTICLLVFFARFNSLKNLIEDKTDLHKNYWVEKKMGNFDAAYEILKRIYVEYLYEDYQNSIKRMGKPMNVDDKYKALLKSECESMGKPMFDF